MNAKLLFGFFLTIIFSTAFCEVKISVTKDENGLLFLKYVSSHNQTFRLIPDEQTVQELGFDPNSAEYLNTQNNLSIGAPIDSLKKYAENPDEITRVAVHKALLLNPVKFTKLTQQYGFFNPCFVAWNGRVLMAWAMASAFNGLPLEGNVPHQGEIRFAWLEKDSFTKISNETLYGIGPEFFLAGSSSETHFLEDARLLVLRNNSLLISFAAIDIHGFCSFRKAIITVMKHCNGQAIPLTAADATLDTQTQRNAIIKSIKGHKNLAEHNKNNTTIVTSQPLSDSLYNRRHLRGASVSSRRTQNTNDAAVAYSLVIHKSIIEFNEKNWITFEYEDKVHYIKNINTMHIAEAITTETGFDIVKNIGNEQPKGSLPWNPAYTEGILRGSSPAILVNGVYLAFFHTKVPLQHGVKRWTYFQGAFTFCPKPPFHINSMSNYPILTPDMYDGPWLSNRFDYMVYPTGIIVNNNKVYVSAGYQNKDLLVFEFNIQELFDSLFLVHTCE